MAGQWCDHFLAYANDAELLDGVYATNDGWTLSSANPPRAGQKNLRCSGGSQSKRLRRVFSDAEDVAGVGYRFYVDSLPTDETGFDGLTGVKLFWFLDAAANCHMCVLLGTDGGLVIYRGYYFSDTLHGGVGTYVDRTAPCLQAKAYNHVEARHHPDAVSGTLEIRVNGVTRYNFVGNTKGPGTLAGASQWAIGGSCALSGAGTMDMCDLHAWDDQPGEGPVDFVGNVGVLPRTLTADTAIADMALSTGVVGYTLLQDHDDATYIEASAVGEKSAFQAGNLPAGTQGIVYQQVMYRALKTDASDCNIRPSFLSGGQEGDCPEQQMTTAETWRWGIIGTDPNSSGGPWPEAACNASQVQFERTL